MNLHEAYVDEVVRELNRQRIESPGSRERWVLEWRMTAPPRRRVAAWLGDRLVATGERLRRWSGAEIPSMRASSALGE